MCINHLFQLIIIVFNNLAFDQSVSVTSGDLIQAVNWSTWTVKTHLSCDLCDDNFLPSSHLEDRILMYSMFVEQGYEPPSKKTCPSLEQGPLDFTKPDKNADDLRIIQVCVGMIYKLKEDTCLTV